MGSCVDDAQFALVRLAKNLHSAFIHISFACPSSCSRSWVQTRYSRSRAEHGSTWLNVAQCGSSTISLLPCFLQLQLKLFNSQLVGSSSLRIWWCIPFLFCERTLAVQPLFHCEGLVQLPATGTDRDSLHTVGTWSMWPPAAGSDVHSESPVPCNISAEQFGKNSPHPHDRMAQKCAKYHSNRDYSSAL